ncbi:hypothetical protein PsAD2_03411 [Pseudovibrio axinellae]|uniref:Uncharacterized protein n=1 Tax=Pseudovibrio axinellae TaxID=989403 RepID=A0A165WQL1_9HYPH|nr:hypothetical protein PsAD2_03411 [Pseudovibrio axinellae]SEQ74354.1 hypothetical protein SAMN05421798_10499 [Pseudovibrio axinellae]
MDWTQLVSTTGVQLSINTPSFSLAGGGVQKVGVNVALGTCAKKIERYC